MKTSIELMGLCNAIAIQVSHIKKALKSTLYKSYEIKLLNVITAKYTAWPKKIKKFATVI